MNDIEIERKFLVTEGWTIPEGLREVPIRQAYITAALAERQVRIRQTPAGSLMAVKVPAPDGSGIATVRTEIEFRIDNEVFERLWTLRGIESLEKVRTAVRVGALEATVDTYIGPLAPLRVVEVEFETVADAAAFEVPAWFGAELTGQTSYGNRALAALATAAQRST